MRLIPSRYTMTSVLFAMAITAATTSCHRSNGARQNDPAIAKLNAYTRVHNTLLNEAGLPLVEKYYLGPGPHALISEKLGFGLDGVGQVLDQARDELKSARAIQGGGMDDADHAADVLLTAINKTTAMLSGVNAYYSSKAYEKDNLVQGRREDSAITANIGEADAAMQRFNAIIEADLKAKSLSDIASFKNKGDFLDYDLKLSLYQAKSAIDLVKDPRDVNNPAIVNKVDKLMNSLQQTLTDLRARIETAKRDQKPNQEQLNPNYEGAAAALASIPQDFVAFQKQPSESTFNGLISSYNNAVNDANYITPM